MNLWNWVRFTEPHAMRMPELTKSEACNARERLEIGTLSKH